MLVWVVLIAGSPNVEAQDVALTKEETVNYINRKLSEVLEKPMAGNFITINKIEYLTDGYLKHIDLLATAIGGCNSGNSIPYGGKKSEITFKPTYITKVDTISGGGSAIGILKIDFIPNTVKWNITEYTKSVEPIYREEYWYTDIWGRAHYTDEYKGDKVNCNSNSRTSNSNSVYIYFLKADPSNYSRLIKAFDHLIALYKAEDDPFGE